MGTGFRSGERGVDDECGQIPMSVRRGEEFVDGEIGCSIGREENVGDVVQGYEFHNTRGYPRISWHHGET